MVILLVPRRVAEVTMRWVLPDLGEAPLGQLAVVAATAAQAVQAAAATAAAELLWER